MRKRVINAARGSRGQSWFTKDIVDLRKALHGAERKWFRCGDTEMKKEKRRVHAEQQRMYRKLTVSRAKKGLKRADN